MKIGWRRAAGAGFALALVAAAALAAGSDGAKARQISGTSTITHGGQTADVGSTTQFHENDVVRVAPDGRLTVEFGDGSYLTMVGPATLSFGPMNGQGNHVRLASGVITEANVHGIALEIQGPEGVDASFVLQNAVGYARVAPGDKIVVQKKEGGAGNAFAKLWRGNNWTDVGETAWTLNVREGSASSGAPTKPAAPKVSPGWHSQFKVQPWPDHPAGGALVFGGIHVVKFTPVKQFNGADTERGGVRLTFVAAGGDDEWGLVQSLGTRWFLADGEWVEFDSEGELVAKSAGVITSTDNNLFDAVLTDESVKDATDASPTIIRKH